MRLLPVVVLLSLAANAKDLKAGAASVDLRPPLGIEMGGYGARIGVSTGVLDPIQAKVLVFEGDQRSVAIVTLDLVGVLPIPLLDQIRAAREILRGNRRCDIQRESHPFRPTAYRREIGVAIESLRGHCLRN